VPIIYFPIFAKTNDSYHEKDTLHIRLLLLVDIGVLRLPAGRGCYGAAQFRGLAEKGFQEASEVGIYYRKCQ
jgi:hypothetical protein